MRHYSLIVCLVWFTADVYASAAAVTELLPQFPRAELVEFEDTQTVAIHEVVTGSLRSRGGTTVPESSEFVTGSRVASTWSIPDEQRTDRVYEFYRSRLAEMGEVLFECQGFDCGSSNHWANKIFKRQIIFGPPQGQHYLVVRVDQDVTYYVAVYLNLRGTGRLYAHTDVIVSESQYTDVTGAVIVDALVSEGRFVMDSGTQDAAIGSVVEAMGIEPLMRIAVVAHERKQRGESVEQAIARSGEIASDYRAQLIEAGINQTRLQAHGIGPLSPVDRKLIDRIELVLISNDERP